jgi:hypothetical protein
MAGFEGGGVGSYVFFCLSKFFSLRHSSHVYCYHITRLRERCSIDMEEADLVFPSKEGALSIMARVKIKVVVRRKA